MRLKKNLDILIGVALKGGVENVINETAPFLQENGFRVRIVQIVFENDKWAAPDIPFFPLLEGREGHTLESMTTAYERFLKSGEGEPALPDVILACGWPYMSVIAKTVSKRLNLPCPVISWCHNPVEIYQRNGYGGYPELSEADAHFAVSKEMEQDIRRHLPDGDVFRVFNPVFIREQKKDSFTEDPRNRLYYIGRLSSEKNVQAIVRGLAAANTGYHLTVIGEGNADEERELLSLSEELGVADRVTFTGWKERPWEEVHNAAALILSSVYEGFGMVIVEALLRGLPVVSTPVAGAKELIEEGVNGFLYNSNHELAGALEKLWNRQTPQITAEACRAGVKPFEGKTALSDFREKVCFLLNTGRIRRFSLPHAFFLDEVRGDFFVPSMMKRFWAEQLSVLAEVERICDRHRISWWIADGTLLGAVRHQGFIPWDDDIDIVMLRPDLERFLSVAQEELPQGFLVLSIKEHPDYPEAVSKVTNGQIINDSADHLRKHHGCPFMAGVDVLALDARYPDPGEEKKRNDLLVLVMEALKECNRDTERRSAEQEKRLFAIEQKAGCSLRRDGHLRYDLLVLREKLCSAAPFDEAEELEVFWNMDGHYVYKKKWFEQTTSLLFEGIPMPAPSGFENILQVAYGDYSIIDRSGGEHLYPTYLHQEELLEEKAGHHVQRYTFRREDLEKERPLRRDRRIQEITAILDKATMQAKAFLENGEESEARQLLMKCGHLTETLENLLNHVPEIVFLVFRPEWWGGIMERLWRQEISSGQAKVCVVRVPWMEKRADGSAGNVHTETEGFPPELSLMTAESYDFGKRCPDVIYTPYPFDGSHAGMDVPESFYSENLLRVTDELVYVPCFEFPDPAPEDGKALYNLNILIEQPAAVFSDRIVVSTERMKQLYVDRLSVLAGKETRPVWEKKLSVEGMPDHMTGSERNANV